MSGAGRSLRPSWFRRAPHYTFRWSVAEAREALSAIVTLWSQSTTRPLMVDLWTLFCRVRAIQHARADSVPWDTFDAWGLVQVVDAGLAVETAIEEFIPPSIGESLGSEGRHGVYLQALIVKALAVLQDDPHETFTEARVALVPTDPGTVWFGGGAFPRRALPCVPALRAEFAWLERPHAKAELLRRGALHRGFPAAVLLDLMRRPNASAPSLFTEGDLDVHLGRLAKAVRIPEAVWRNLDARAWGDRRQTILAQAAEKVATAKSMSTDPLERIAQALDGALDSVPRAVRFDLFDASRKGRRQSKQRQEAEQLTVEFRETASVGPTAPPLLDQLDALVEAFLAEHPQSRRGLTSYLSGEPLHTAAAGDRSVQAVSQQRRRARDAFVRWCRARGVTPD